MRYHLTEEAPTQLVFLKPSKKLTFSVMHCYHGCFYYRDFTFNGNLSFLNYCKFTLNCNFSFLAFSFRFLILSCAFEHFMAFVHYKCPIIIVCKIQILLYICKIQFHFGSDFHKIWLLCWIKIGKKRVIVSVSHTCCSRPGRAPELFWKGCNFGHYFNISSTGSSPGRSLVSLYCWISLSTRTSSIVWKRQFHN